jgi:importin subunit alpha-6/7
MQNNNVIYIYIYIYTNNNNQAVIDAGCVPLLVSFLDQHDDPALQLEAGWALTNIASGSTEQTDTVIQARAVPAFVKLLKTSTSVQIREQSVKHK